MEYISRNSTRTKHPVKSGSHGSNGMVLEDNRINGLPQQGITNFGTKHSDTIQLNGEIPKNLPTTVRHQIYRKLSLEDLLNLRATSKNNKQHIDEFLDPDIKAINQAYGKYNSINPEEDRDYQERLYRLNELERAVYGWLDVNIKGAIRDHPMGELMVTLLYKAQREHQKMVSEIAENPGLLPFDTVGVEGNYNTLLKVWRKIVTGKGNLKIKEDQGEGFRERMLAAIAKLMATPDGRELISNLSEKQDSSKLKVILGTDFQQELEALGHDDPEGTQAVPRTPMWNPGERGPMISRLEQGDQEPEKVGTNPWVETPEIYHHFVTNLPPGTTHFKWGGKIYRVGQGVGSFVKIMGSDAIDTHIGERGQEIVTPEFITLGHELGHSLRFLKGTEVHHADDKAKYGFEGSALDNELWRTATEYLNIMGLENRLRSQQGISRRKYHASDWEAVQPMFEKERLMKELFVLERMKKINRRAASFYMKEVSDEKIEEDITKTMDKIDAFQKEQSKKDPNT